MPVSGCGGDGGGGYQMNTYMDAKIKTSFENQFVKFRLKFILIFSIHFDLVIQISVLGPRHVSSRGTASNLHAQEAAQPPPSHSSKPSPKILIPII